MRRSRSQTPAPTAALPVLALLLLACGSDDAARRPEAQLARSEAATAAQPATARPAPAPATTVTPAETSLREEDIRSNVAHFDPTLSGWTTEAFHDHVKGSFKVLGHHFEEGVFDPAEYAEIVTQDAAIGQMRPAEPALTHSSPPVTVRRVGESAESAGRGAEGLAAAVRGLRAPYEGLPAPRPAWKIIKVSLDGNRGHTYVRLETSAHDERRSLQQVTHWRVDWIVEDLNQLKGMRIAKLESESLDEVEIALPGGRLLTDATPAVLADDDLQAALRPGVSELWGRTETTMGLHAYGHHGVAVGDPNGDGLEDLYVLDIGGRPNRLLLQEPDGTVRDATDESGAGWLDWSLAALFVDLDGDADEDLVVSTDAGVLLLENDGAARFSRREVIGMRTPPGHLSAADFDGDGDLDLHVCRYAADPTVQLGNRTLPVPYHDANNGARNVLLRNDGAFRFEDITGAVGLDENGTRFSYAAAWEDFDDDGDLDLYVANDFGRNNLYRNEGGTFRDVAGALGVEDISAGMGVAWADVDGDGRSDLHVSNMFSSAGNRITYQRKFRPGGDEEAIEAMQRHARGNSLFRNLGEAGFEDISVEAGITMGRWAWAAEFADLDLDGREDLVVTNGFVTNEDSKDL